MRRAALLAAALLCRAPAFAAPLDAFTTAFGTDGVQTLAERGYLVLQGRGAARRLAAVHWKALEALAAAAPFCRSLTHEFAACRVLPPDGVMTPRLHALAASVVAEDEERFALTSSSASTTEPAGLPNLFETKWGADFAARRRADRIEEPAALAKGYFEEFLAGPRPNPAAVKHFLAVEAARGASGGDVRLAADAARGAASDELRMLIRRYLQDERRRRGLALAHARVTALTADKDTRRDLDALTALASKLAADPGLLAALETAVSGAPAPAGVPKLRSAGIHLQDPTRLGQYELGDEASISGAYWVDGLDEGVSAEVEETTYLETPRGFSAVETRAVKRRDGGPYPFERRLTISETHPFAFVAVVSAASGTIVSERAEIPIAPDFELSLGREAEALQDSQSCDPKSAEAAYGSLADLVADAAKVKPQYRALLDRARRGRAKAAADAALLAKLEDAVAAARADSSPEQCRYSTARTDAAIALARKLPAGCDKVLPELFVQRAAISRRAVDQDWFLKASADARSRRRSCDFAQAADRWTAALAVLAVDPAARCGKADDEAKAVEVALPAARLAQAWSEALDKTLDKAEAETVPAKRLGLLAPAIARLSALDDLACRRGALKRAERLAEKVGSDETAPSDADASRRLPADSSLASVSEDVRRARARNRDKSDTASAPETAPAPAAPAPAPAAKKPSAKRAAKKAAAAQDGGQ
jgi:hypothetical protein